MSETAETDLVERADESMRRIAAMCAEGRGPRMSVPADHAQDDDLFICDTIRAMKSTISAQAAVIETLRRALEIIAGKRQPFDNLMGNVDVALAALDALSQQDAKPALSDPRDNSCMVIEGEKT